MSGCGVVGVGASVAVGFDYITRNYNLTNISQSHDLAPSHNLTDLSIHNLAHNKLEVGCCAVIERNECRY